MFGRRVASCCCIPASMYARLHISSPQQASRMLPPLVPITTSICRSVSGGTGAFASLVAGSEAVPADLTSAGNLLSLLGVTPQVLLGAINANTLLLRIISDTMCTYSVILLHTIG
ncbi:conserved [Leishmania donovani]|nr:conserved [Leishmania donovani]